MKRPHKHTGIFHYAGKDIVFNFWLLPKEDISPDTVIFLGAGQTGNITRWIAQAAGPGVVVVDGLPHWEAHPNGEDTARFSLNYVQAAFEIVIKTFENSPMNIIGESQAAPAVVVLVHNLSEAVRNLVLINLSLKTPT